MILSFLNLGLYLFLGLPIVILLVTFASHVFHSFFGGPVWLWFIIFIIIGLCSSKSKFEEQMRKLKKSNETNES